MNRLNMSSLTLRSIVQSVVYPTQPTSNSVTATSVIVATLLSPTAFKVMAVADIDIKRRY